MNSHSHYNYGQPIYPPGVSIYFPSIWDTEDCRKELRNRGVKLTSGTWDGICLDGPAKSLLDLCTRPYVTVWSVKPDWRDVLAVLT